MVQGPIDYTTDVKDPFMQGLQGYQIAQNMAMQRDQRTAQQQAMAQQQAAAQAKAQQAQQYKLDLADFSQKTNKTAADYENFLLKYPQQREAIKESYGMQSEEKSMREMAKAQQIQYAIAAGKYEIAKQIMTQQMEEAQAQGDGLKAESLKMMIENFDDNPQAVADAIGFSQATILGKEKFGENLSKLDEAMRQRDLHPDAIKKQRSEIIKIGVESGLKEKEALKVESTIRKLDAETKKIIMEMASLKQGGNLSPDKKIEVEQKLADKYYTRNKDYLDRIGAYNNLVESAKQDSGPGDFALIVAFNKMLDPRSVVRESEFALAEASSGRMQLMLNFFKKFKEGDRLKKHQRQQFVDLAKKYMEEAEKNKKIVNDQLSLTVEAYGLNKDLVIPKSRVIESTNLEDSTEKNLEDSTETKTLEQTATNPNTGQKIVFRDGQWVDFNSGSPI